MAKGDPIFIARVPWKAQRCCRCGEDKPLEDFHRDAGRANGRTVYCKACRLSPESRARRAAQTREWRLNNREKALASYRKQDLKRHFDMTPEQYDALLAEQDGKCAICRCDQCATGRRFAVDHNHETGAVRGLLCTNCNQGIGHFQEDPEVLHAAIAYVQRSDALQEDEAA